MKMFPNNSETWLSNNKLQIIMIIKAQKHIIKATLMNSKNYL